MAESKEPKYKIKVPKLDGVKKTYDFSLSLPGMISVVGVGVLALTAFFIMGILIGRGYRPEQDITQLQEYMPTKEQHLADAPQPPTVLTPEELEYQDRLKAPSDQLLDEVAPKEEAKKDTPAPKPEKKAETAAKADAKPKVKAEAAPKVEEQVTAAPGEPVFDYVYQVAAFKQAEMAESLSDKLKADGLRTHIQNGDVKGTTWHRVQVLYHGTPASTSAMKAVLAKHGIKKPLLKKKVAAN